MSFDITRQHLQILSYLREDRFVTSETLARRLGTSDKTMRKRLRELRDALRASGAEIEGKQRQGFRIVVSDRMCYLEFLDEHSLELSDGVPSNSDERVARLIFELIDAPAPGWRKIDDISGRFFVSRDVISSDLHELEAIVARYNLAIERRPNYGIRVVGSELAKRACLARQFLASDPQYLFNSERVHRQQRLASIVRQVLDARGISMTDPSFESLLLHMYIAQKRMEEGNSPRLDATEITEELGQGVIDIAMDLACALERETGRAMDGSEVAYLAIQLAGKLAVSTEGELGTFRVSVRAKQLCVTVLDRVLHAFGYAFAEDPDVRLLLQQHLTPLVVRLKYNMPMKNPTLDHIKFEYPFAFVMATYASSIIADELDVRVDEGEAGYLALLFQYALEKRRLPSQRKNVLVVCGSARATARLLRQRLQHLYEEYIGSIDICAAYELDRMDYDSIDLVFTTVRLERDLPVPVIEVERIPEVREQAIVSKLAELHDGEERPYLAFFTPELFFTDIDSSSKEAILREVCGRVAAARVVDPRFYELVMRREALGGTSLGRFVAIPHPFERASEASFAAVALLPRPVDWGGERVSVVLLLSPAGDEESRRLCEEDLERLFRALYDFAFDEDAVGKVLATPTFTTFIEAFSGGRRPHPVPY